jgi:YD repeat-containing protein
VSPQFNALQVGIVNNFSAVIDATAAGTFPINCTLLTGIRGGADDPPIALKTIQDVQQAPAAILPSFTSVPFTGFFNDPVSTATGELYHPNIPPDLSLGGPLPVEFRRYYASLINANGFVTRIGNNWMHNYEYRVGISGSTATVTFFGGKAAVFNASGNSWQLASPDLFGYQLANGPGANHQFLDPASNRIYTFDTAGSLIKIEDRNGNALNNQLPMNGTAQVSDGLGRSITLTYSADGKLTKVADQTGRAVSFAYNGNDLSQVIDANGKVETYAYTAAVSMVGLMTSSTLPLGNKPFTQVWDTSGKVTQQSDSRGNTTTYAYDPAGVAPTSITDPLGALQQQVHANYKTETSYTDANGNTISMGYDTNGHRTSVTDSMGDTTTVTYHNPSGYLASVTDALGNTTTYTYATQVQGPFTFYVLTTIQYADGTSVSMAYDNLGNVTSITDAAGKVTKFTYNGHGQVLTATNPAGGVTTYTYNADATVASETDVSGNTSIFSYDSQKRPAQLKHADGSTAAFT